MRACLYLAVARPGKEPEALKVPTVSQQSTTQPKRADLTNQGLLIKVKLQKIKLAIFPRIENGSPNKDVVRVPVVQQDRLCCRGEDGRGLSMAQGLL